MYTLLLCSAIKWEVVQTHVVVEYSPVAFKQVPNTVLRASITTFRP